MIGTGTEIRLDDITIAGPLTVPEQVPVAPVVHSTSNQKTTCRVVGTNASVDFPLVLRHAAMATTLAGLATRQRRAFGRAVLGWTCRRRQQRSLQTLGAGRKDCRSTSRSRSAKRPQPRNGLNGWPRFPSATRRSHMVRSRCSTASMSCRGRRICRLGRPFGLRQVHTAAHDRRPGSDHRRRHPDRRSGSR